MRRRIFPTRESPVATTYGPVWILAAIYQSNQQKPVCQCAACYLTWLSDSSSAHYCTQTHRPVMIYCLAAYGIELELSGQLQGVKWRKFQTNTLSAEIPGSLLFQTTQYIFIICCCEASLHKSHLLCH